jgi:hypothetical protein
MPKFSAWESSSALHFHEVTKQAVVVSNIPVEISTNANPTMSLLRNVVQESQEGFACSPSSLEQRLDSLIGSVQFIGPYMPIEAFVAGLVPRNHIYALRKSLHQNGGYLIPVLLSVAQLTSVDDLCAERGSWVE